jgi:hypothetical protein
MVQPVERGVVYYIASYKVPSNVGRQYDSSQEVTLAWCHVARQSCLYSQTIIFLDTSSQGGIEGESL